MLACEVSTDIQAETLGEFAWCKFGVHLCLGINKRARALISNFSRVSWHHWLHNSWETHTACCYSLLTHCYSLLTHWYREARESLWGKHGNLGGVNKPIAQVMLVWHQWCALPYMVMWFVSRCYRYVLMGSCLGLNVPNSIKGVKHFEPLMCCVFLSAHCTGAHIHIVRAALSRGMCAWGRRVFVSCTSQYVLGGAMVHETILLHAPLRVWHSRLL